MNSISNFINSLPNEDPALVRPSSRKSTSVGMNTPLFRRDSTTEEILPPDLVEVSSDDLLDDSSSSSSLQNESSFSIHLKSTFNHILDTFTCEIDEEHTMAASHAIFLGQKGSEQNKAKAVTLDREEFQKLKAQLRNSGMVTNFGSRAVLNSIVEGCAEELREANRTRSSMRHQQAKVVFM